ncbi:MAG: hypothetical protein HC780_05830 [Leptolyngbyaceae cyanobacterium CSU_1_3]|nr:hypothetical protein [Leptolyngbyaceae cyanobacterium CSU_1_3]
MSQLPDDDQEWVEFLRQHRPLPPPAADGLEDRIFSALEAETLSPIAAAQLDRKRRPRWLVPSAIAASLVAAFLSHRILTPPQPSPTELALLEDFIETNWQNTLHDSDPQFLPPGDDL